MSETRDANTTTAYQDPPGQLGGASGALADLLATWLPGQRWFANRSEKVAGVTIESRTKIADLDGRSVEQVLFTVPSPSGTNRYQLWVGWAGYYPARYGHVFIRETGG